MAKVAVIGAGSWGTALAKVLHTNGNQVTVWSIVEAEIAMLRERHEHVDKLPGVKLPEDMEFTTDLKAAVEDKEYLLFSLLFVLLERELILRAVQQTSDVASVWQRALKKIR